MRNVIFLVISMILTIWCSKQFIFHPTYLGFGFCLLSSMLVGCCTMVIVEELKKYHNND